MAQTTPPPAPPIPVLLLKTKSSPADAYEELFAAATTAQNGGFEPLFVPVLEHRFDDAGVARLRGLLVGRRIANTAPEAAAALGGPAYGGLIFTSQRAVEALAAIVAEGDGSARAGPASGQPAGHASWPYLQDVPVYSVGPATTRALRAIPQQPPLHVSGEHTGNGEDLAHYIREHYAGWPRDPAAGPAGPGLPRLLFVVGEKRRDIIPKVLMGTGAGAGAGTGTGADAAAAAAAQTQTPTDIPVDEIVVYGTGVMPSFPADFQQAMRATQERPLRWVVVFSPTGCDSMLAALGLIDPDTGKARDAAPGPRTAFVATIGPTTRAYLRDTFGFEADVCADEPSPQGILRGITQFMAARAAS